MLIYINRFLYTAVNP